MCVNLLVTVSSKRAIKIKIQLRRPMGISSIDLEQPSSPSGLGFVNALAVGFTISGILCGGTCIILIVPSIKSQ